MGMRMTGGLGELGISSINSRYTAVASLTYSV